MEIEKEMKMLHNMQTRKKIPNPFLEHYEGDDVTIVITSNEKCLIAYSLPINNDFCYIRTLYVPPKFRKLGYAKMHVLGLIKNMVENQNCMAFEADVESVSIGFFKKLQFKKMPNREHNRMRLDLRINK